MPFDFNAEAQACSQRGDCSCEDLRHRRKTFASGIDETAEDAQGDAQARVTLIRLGVHSARGRDW
jgi:hypothetical protein